MNKEITLLQVIKEECDKRYLCHDCKFFDDIEGCILKPIPEDWHLDKLNSGTWIPIPNELDCETDAECSLCHKKFIAAMNYTYCPNCGAWMVRGEAQDD